MGWRGVVASWSRTVVTIGVVRAGGVMERQSCGMGWRKHAAGGVYAISAAGCGITGGGLLQAFTVNCTQEAIEQEHPKHLLKVYRSKTTTCKC